MHKLLAAILAVTGCWLMPTAAHACLPIMGWTVESGLADPKEAGISPEEKARREAALDRWKDARRQERLADWQAVAEQGLAAPAIDHARDLIEAVLPPPVAVTMADGCGSPWPYYSDPADHFFIELSVLIPRVPLSQKGNGRHLWYDFRERYLELAYGCRAESRDGLASWVLTEFHRRLIQASSDGSRSRSDEALARVWAEVTRLGFLQRGLENPRPMFKLAEDGSLQFTDDPNYAPSGLLLGLEGDPRSEVDGAIARDNREAMRRFWREDGDARAVLEAIAAVHSERARPDRHFAGLCPETLRNVEALARATLLQVNRSQAEELEAVLSDGD